MSDIADEQPPYRPDFVEEEHLVFLDALRESGVTNMFGAGPHVQDEFDVDRKTANAIVGYWMLTFSARYPRPAGGGGGEGEN